MDNFRTEIHSVLGACVTNRLSETIHNLSKATLAESTILSNICILLSMGDEYLPIGPRSNRCINLFPSHSFTQL